MLPFKGHRHETEYQRSYKKSQYDCAAVTYQENLDFRREQKRRFVEHNPDPFDWDPEDVEELDGGSDFNCEDLNRSSNLTHTQYKHEKLNRLYERRLTDKQESSHSGVGMTKIQSNTPAKDFQLNNRKHQVVGRKEETDYDGSRSESETSVVHIIEPELVKKSSTKLSSPYADKQTQTDRKSSKREIRRSLPGPFLPYGYEADARKTGKKLTHNIRAAREIYPSALRAQRLRKGKAEDKSQARCGKGLSGRNGQISDHLQKANSEPFRVFVHNECDDDDDNPDWVTEYDNKYQPYHEKEYKKSATSSQVHSHEFTPHIHGRSHKQTHI